MKADFPFCSSLFISCSSLFSRLQTTKTEPFLTRRKMFVCSRNDNQRNDSGFPPRIIHLISVVSLVRKLFSYLAPTFLNESNQEKPKTYSKKNRSFLKLSAKKLFTLNSFTRKKLTFCWLNLWNLRLEELFIDFIQRKQDQKSIFLKPFSVGFGLVWTKVSYFCSEALINDLCVQVCRAHREKMNKVTSKPSRILTTSTLQYRDILFSRAGVLSSG